MSVKGIENLRQILLMALFGVLLCYLTVSAIGQSEQARPAQNPAPGAVQSPKKNETPPAPPPLVDQNETIKINSSLVAVPVSVTDASGEPVRNLTADDFEVEEEGKSQQVVSLGEPGKTPVELALLFDVSGSVFERFQFQKQAASKFLKEVL